MDSLAASMPMPTHPSDVPPTAAEHLAQRLGEGHVYSLTERAQLEAANQWRILERRRALVADSYATAEVARAFGVSRQTPHDWVRQGRILALRDRGQLRFSRWQFAPESDSVLLPGLSAVLAALHARSDLARANWFVFSNPYLDERTPADMLKAGHSERVVDAARLVGSAAA